MSSSKPRIEKKPFGTTFDGQAVDRITLTNAAGASAGLITYGATLTSLTTPDRNGRFGDVVLGFDNLEQYENESPYFGATIGRVGNRIAKGLFAVDGVPYAVAVNDGLNHLHGGFRGYDKRVWQVDAAMTSDGPAAKFTLFDPDGAEGYPGDVDVTVIFTLTAANGIKIQYLAHTDQPTPINLTNHTYWNLKDAGATDVLSHRVQIEADAYVPVDSTLIPTGQILPVEGTPIDFRAAKPLGRDIEAMGGYDHNLALRNQSGAFARAVEVTEETSGRRMEVWTTQPGVQLYSGNFLDGSVKGKGGVAYGKHHALCLETQHYPDSINHADFPDAVLRPHAVYRQVTEYRFSTVS